MRQRQWEAPIARSATRNSSDDATRPATQRTLRRHGRADMAGERSQEELWAACIADEPALIGDIVKFITAARERIIESPPVAPVDDPKLDQPPQRK